MPISNAKSNSFPDRLYSSPLMRGFYKNEKPEIGFDLTGSNGEQKRLAHLINSIAENSLPVGKF